MALDTCSFLLRGSGLDLTTTPSSFFQFYAVYGTRGFGFSWCNKRLGLANIWERLDRAISNVGWHLAFPNAEIHHHPITTSDHVSSILSLFGKEESDPKNFKFELFWTREPTCYGVAAEAWAGVDADSPACGLLKKIRAVCYALRQWNKKHFGKIQESIQCVKDQLAACQLTEPTSSYLQMEADLKLVLDEQLHREEILWRQKVTRDLVDIQ